MKPKELIEITIENQFTEELDALRTRCFPGKDQTENSYDPFDDKSYFVVLRTNHELVGYGRLTPGPNSVFYTWSKGKAPLPNSNNSIDLGRCMIAPKYRGFELLKPLCLAGIMFSQLKKFHHVNGASIPNRGLVNMLEEIGFAKSGSPVKELEPNGNEVVIQPLTCDLNKLTYKPEKMLDDIAKKLLDNKIQLVNKIQSSH